MEKRTRPDELPSGTFFLDDSNISMIKYSGSFSQISNSTCQGGTCTRLTSSASSMEFTFNGTDVWLFGMPGGITRVFLDGTLVDVLDTSTLAYNGSALWASTNLRQGPHAVKLGGVEGEGLNLVFDFFSINGAVTSTGGTDANYLPPEKLTPIIVGSVLGFLALLAIIALAFFLRFRRKKQKQIRKSGIKLVKVVEPPTDANGTAEPKTSPTRGGFLSGIFPRRQGTLLGFGGRRGAGGAQSPDGLSPFLQQSHASTGSSYPTNTTTSANVYSPPTSADPLVPFFPRARSNSPPRRQKTLPGAGGGTDSARPSIEQSLAAGTSTPPRGQVKPVVALANTAAGAAAGGAGASRPVHNRNNDSFASRNSEDAPLMEVRPKHPPAYDQSQQIQQQRQQPQPPAAGGVTAQGFPDEKSRATGSTPTPASSVAPTPVSTPPTTAPTSGALWSATTVSSMPMTASTIRQHQQTSSTSSSSQYPPEKATYNRLTAAAAAAIPSSPPPSFLDIDAHSPPPSGAPATSYRNPAMAGGSSTAAAMVAAAQRNNAIQQAKNMKGPRPRDGSSPPPTAQGGRQLPTTPVPAPADNGRGAGTRVEDWNRLGGVRLTGSSTSLSNRRNPTDFPESPIDPAVQWS